MTKAGVPRKSRCERLTAAKDLAAEAQRRRQQTDQDEAQASGHMHSVSAVRNGAATKLRGNRRRYGYVCYKQCNVASEGRPYRRTRRPQGRAKARGVTERPPSAVAKVHAFKDGGFRRMQQKKRTAPTTVRIVL